MMKRQKVLADFGDFALRCAELDTILNEGCRLMHEAMGTDLAKVLEIEHGEACRPAAAAAEPWLAPTMRSIRSPAHRRKLV